MEIMTTKTNELHGIAYGEEDVIRFESGVPGFENLKRFLLAMNPEHEPFVWLYSIENPRIRFLMVNPMTFRPDYMPNMHKEHIADLQIDRKEDLLLFVIVTMQSNPRESTVNLAGPVLVNIARKLGKQVILDDGRYSIRERLMPEGN